MKRYYCASAGLDEETSQKVVRELRLGYLNLSEGMFEQAKLNFLVTISMDKTCADAYWGLMLCKLEIRNEDELLEDPLPHKNAINIDEFERALDYANEDQKKCYKSMMEGVFAVNASDSY